jgi:hypothetical protein
VQGGFYFHPSDEVGALWASLATPGRKKPFECLLSVYSNSENTIDSKKSGLIWHMTRRSNKGPFRKKLARDRFELSAEQGWSAQKKNRRGPWGSTPV